MTSPVSMPAGHEIVAADLDAYENLTGAWTSYTPTWTASSSNPSLGNGTIAGAYVQTGKTVELRFNLSMGSTTTFGTGTYFISLPVAAFTALQTGVLQLFDSSAGLRAPGAVRIDGGLAKFLMCANSGVLTPTVPWTWATSDEIVGHLRYQVA